MLHDSENQLMQFTDQQKVVIKGIYKPNGKSSKNIRKSELTFS